MERLTARTEQKEAPEDFYDISFSSMDQKLALCVNCRDEMHMVNMASRDAAVTRHHGWNWKEEPMM